MYGLSDTAWTIMQAVYHHYNTAKSNSKCFYDLDQFNLSHEDLMKYCTELDDASFVIIEYDENEKMYLYMLPKILPGMKK